MPQSKDDQFEHLRQALLPILAEATISNFTSNVPMPKGASRETTELLVGVQALMNVIRQQQAELETTQAQLREVQDRTTEILARVLDRSLPAELPHRSAHKV